MKRLGLFALWPPVATIYGNLPTCPRVGGKLSDSLPVMPPLVNKLVANEPEMQQSSKVRVQQRQRKTNAD